MVSCLEYRRKVGQGILGEVTSFRTRSRRMMPAAALLLSAMPDEKCPLFYSLSRISASSETIRGNNNHCHLVELTLHQDEKTDSNSYHILCRFREFESGKSWG